MHTGNFFPEGPLSKDTHDEMHEHHYRIEKSRLYEQLLLKKMFPKVNDVRKFKEKDAETRLVRFKGLEEAREVAFNNYKNNHYIRVPEGIARLEWIEAEVTGKGNEHNIPIDKDTDKDTGQDQERKVPYQEWSHVKMKFADDDFPGETTIQFKKREGEWGAFHYRDYKDDEKPQETTYDALDQVAVLARRKANWVTTENGLALNRDENIEGAKIKKIITRQDVFKEAAKKYKSNQNRIFGTHFGPKGVNEQVDHYQKKYLKNLHDNDGHWQTFGEKVFDKLKDDRQEIQDLKKENIDLKNQLVQIQQRVQEGKKIEQGEKVELKLENKEQAAMPPAKPPLPEEQKGEAVPPQPPKERED